VHSQVVATRVTQLMCLRVLSAFRVQNPLAGGVCENTFYRWRKGRGYRSRDRTAFAVAYPASRQFMECASASIPRQRAAMRHWWRSRARH